ncbi:hypothetical protein KO02_01540 [Sphingobacterium sp. ML3W]|uniref:hypothetical protein n=1 Tax=Sphingobacterium sp. ML3W TaxID=1538644 RepID=UPI0004F82D58|nr:hypothetical protein [Sphingobacterium sp. ML3W]AIM35488.1 hypothetical protein KO02_01540 [Sphingobacterium sp. ML3W]
MGTLKNNGLRACLALFILLFGIFVVVKAMEKKENVTSNSLIDPSWYYTSGDPTLPSSYSSTPNPNCGNGVVVICEIQAPANTADPSHPVLDSTAKNNIQDALDAKTDNATVKSFRDQ